MDTCLSHTFQIVAPDNGHGYLHRCVLCNFEQLFKQPLRKDISNPNCVHDWHSMRFPLSADVSFCFHCNATTPFTERVDADASVLECDHCGPSEFVLYCTWPTFPVQRAYECKKCNRRIGRFTWAKQDWVNMDSVLALPAAAAADKYTFPPANFIHAMQRNWNFGERLCDGCATVVTDAKEYQAEYHIMIAHFEDEEASMRFVRKKVVLDGMEMELVLEHCPECRKKTNYNYFKVLYAHAEAYEKNDMIARALAKLKQGETLKVSPTETTP